MENLGDLTALVGNHTTFSMCKVEELETPITILVTFLLVLEHHYLLFL
jgi:hypothetical protein